jgi:hypothetical protein
VVRACGTKKVARNPIQQFNASAVCHHSAPSQVKPYFPYILHGIVYQNNRKSSQITKLLVQALKTTDLAHKMGKKLSEEVAVDSDDSMEDVSDTKPSAAAEDSSSESNSRQADTASSDSESSESEAETETNVKYALIHLFKLQRRKTNFFFPGQVKKQLRNDLQHSDPRPDS